MTVGFYAPMPPARTGVADYAAALVAELRRHGLRQLSMGMSHDLEAAIEEGATCVRVGTALFGKRTT